MGCEEVKVHHNHKSHHHRSCRRRHSGRSHEASYPNFEDGTFNYIEWAKWEKLLRDASTRSSSLPPPTCAVTTSTSSPQSWTDRKHEPALGERRQQRRHTVPVDRYTYASPATGTLLHQPHQDDSQSEQGHEGRELPSVQSSTRCLSPSHSKATTRKPSLLSMQARSADNGDEDTSSELSRWSPKRLACGFFEDENDDIPWLSPKRYPDSTRLEKGDSHRTNTSERGPYVRLPSKRHDVQMDSSVSSPSKKSESLSHFLSDEDDSSRRSTHTSFSFHKRNPFTSHDGKPTSRREWYERSDSLKGKPVSSKYCMHMVYFETIEEVPE